MSELHWSSRDEARSWVRAEAKALSRPALVLLSGDLGAGKTQLVKWFLEELGAQDVASPTFAVHHQYRTPDGPVDHVDLYRVESADDLESSGFWDLFINKNRFILIEWADRLPRKVWPRDWTRLYIDLAKVAGGEESRRARIELIRP